MSDDIRYRSIMLRLNIAKTRRVGYCSYRIFLKIFIMLQRLFMFGISEKLRKNKVIFRHVIILLIELQKRKSQLQSAAVENRWIVSMVGFWLPVDFLLWLVFLNQQYFSSCTMRQAAANGALLVPRHQSTAPATVYSWRKRLKIGNVHNRMNYLA